MLIPTDILQLDYPGNTIETIIDTLDPSRCCDLCNVHHSCLFWTYHYKKKECELKVAKSDEVCCDPSHTTGDCPKSCEDVIISGSRSGDPPAQDWAHFCFDCKLPSSFQNVEATTDARSEVARGFPMFQ